MAVFKKFEICALCYFVFDKNPSISSVNLNKTLPTDTNYFGDDFDGMLLYNFFLFFFLSRIDLRLQC